MPYEIQDWEVIADRYRSNLLLGNGASIAVDTSFDYGSLRGHAADLNLITDSVEDVFQFFDTDDFELILRVLWHAQNVNEALGTVENRTRETYRDVRRCMIETVRDIHPVQQHMGFPVEHIAAYMRRFDHVLSLNYDLIVYWAIMVNQGNLESHAYKDCFVNGNFDEDWERFSHPIRGEQSCTTVFYPHGNLALARDRVEAELKVAAQDDNHLLATILHEWENGSCVPLFVSEGTSEQKVRSILGSSYLSTVLRSVMPSLQESLVVYGWSFGEHDRHILKALGNSGIRRIAVSVYGGNQRFCEHVASELQDHFGRPVDLEFFDAESEHCWARA